MSKKMWMLLVSDLHLGSAFSIWPPNFVGSSGTTMNLNSGQEYLWKNRDILIGEVREMTRGKIDIFCLVGDAVHGKNKKGEGEYIIEPDMMFQAYAAIETISPFLDISNERYVFRGSRYHVGANAEAEEFVGREIGAVPDDFGHNCWMWLPSLDVNGVVFDISHHRSAVMINRSMPLEREGRFSHQISELKKSPHAIIRGHGHVQAQVMIDGDLQIGLMPMALQGDYCQMSKTPNRLVSKWLGICLLEITPGNLGTARYPIDVHWLRFKHPQLPSRSYGGEKWQKNLLSRILQ